MAKIVECVPNFSEGRRKDVIESIVGEIRSVKGVKLLDVESDKDHNRSVVTYVGEPKPVQDAAYRAIKKASELIEMEHHKGEHPRIGATDVVPFIPISGVTLEECVALARDLGKKVGEELGIPVYLYEAAATRPERQNLADIRKGEYEGLKEEIGKPERRPDFGPAKMHKAGATVIGARGPLVAYNVYLSTNKKEIADKIARAVRFKDGGYRYCKALGFEIKERGLVQVSMNLTDYTKTPIFRVFETIRAEAERYGVSVVSSEVIGLVPMDALVECAEFYLKLENFKRDQVLEKKLME